MITPRVIEVYAYVKYCLLQKSDVDFAIVSQQCHNPRGKPIDLVTFFF
jgi:hypothetical protein